MDSTWTAFNEGLRQQHDYASRALLALGLMTASAAYLHLFVRRLAPARGLLAVIPLLVLNTWMPLLFDSRAELLSRLVLSLLSFWLGNFKAIGLCLNRGPIAGINWNLSQVCLLYMGPIYPRQDGPVKKGRLTDSAGPTSKLLCIAAAHAVVLSVLAYLLAEVPLPVTVKHYVYAFALCSFVSFLMNGPAAVLTSLAELDVVPPFDRPWMSTSLADFWSRRWNNTVSLTLRSLIYDPIVEGCWIHRGPAMPAGPEAAAAAAGADSSNTNSTDSSSSSSAAKPPRVHPLKKLAGTAATFAVSGIMHEFVLLYALHEGNSYPAGFWFMFFFSQMPLLVLEDLVRRRMRKAGVRPSRPLGIGWTTLILMISAYFFWYPPVEQYTDVALRVVASVNASAASAVHSVQALLQSLGLQQAAVSGAAFVSSVSGTAL